MRSLRSHGQGEDKYDNVRIGLNGRLDTMQAAILIEKLKIFEDEIAARNAVADRYAGLATRVVNYFGAIAWTGAGYYGHVAYVESVNGDGTITVSEMNYDHFNRIDQRWIPIGDKSIRGYIYP